MVFFYKTIRNLNDDELLKFINTIYEDGYVDGYNGNNIETKFNNQLEIWYENLTN